MGTIVHVCLVAEDRAEASRLAGAASAAHEAVAEVDAALSGFLPTSDLSRLNRSPGRWLPVGPHLVAVASAAEHHRTLTGGVFDATGAGPRTDGPRLRWRERDGGWQAWLAPGHRADFGGIAKGYAADLARERCRDRAAGVLVSVGTSSIALAGVPARRDTWRIAIGSPWAGQAEALGYIEVSGGSFSMSGVRGHRLGDASLVVGHLLDPRSGGPTRTDVCAVGVLGDDGMCSEALSTAMMVLGLHDGMALARGLAAAALVLTASGEMVATPTMAPRVAVRARE
jgi:thiamine biosynthesis lipoprotein